MILQGRHITGPGTSLTILVQVCCFSLFFWLTPVSLCAQQTLEETHQALRKQLELITKDVESLTDDETRTSFESRIKAVDTSLIKSANDQQEISRLKTKLENAESLSRDIDTEITALKEEQPERLDLSGLNLAELNRKQTELQTEITRLQSEQSRLDQAIKSSRVENIDLDIAETNREIQAAQQAIDDLRPNVKELTEQLRLLELQVKQHRFEQRRAFLLRQQQMSLLNEQFDLDRKELTLTTLKLSRADELNKQVSAAIIQLRQAAAREQATQAAQKATQVSDQFPMLAASVDVNVSIAKQIEELEKDAAKTALQSDKRHRQLKELTDKFVDTESRIRSIRHSDTVGTMLRKRKRELPSASEQQQQAVIARKQLAEIQRLQFETMEQLEELSAETIRKEVEKSGTTLTDNEWKMLATAVNQVVERRRQRLIALDKLLDRLFTDYLDIATTNSNIARVVEKFEEFINERILWLRSNRLLFTEFKIDGDESELISAEKWKNLGETVKTAIGNQLLPIAIGTILLVILLALRSRMRLEVDLLGEIAGRGSCATFWPTFRASILTTLIAVTVPLAIYGFGLALKQMTPSGNLLFDALSTALVTASQYAIPLEVLRRVCRTNGLATKHFDWTDDSVEKLKNNLNWYILPAAILVFLISFFMGIDSAHGVDLIERVLFVFAMIMTTYFLYRVISPKTGIFSRYLTRHENSWANQTSIVWFSLILLVPIALAILAIAGYYYTALNLTNCLFVTFGFAVVVELGRALIRRFVLVRRRAAHIEKARRIREAEIEAEKQARKKAAAERQRRIEAGENVAEDDSALIPMETMPEPGDESTDIDANAGQANQLIQLMGWTVWVVGLWFIWSDVLPAMKALDEYKLWGTTQVAAASTAQQADLATTALTGMPGTNLAAPDSAAPTESGSNGNVDGVTPEPSSIPDQNQSSTLFQLLYPPEDDGVSLMDFLIFLAIVLITYFAARNLPNAFEMLFLEELPVDRSARFASKALFSYAIVIVGVMLALRTLSINWTSIQWLVTALTFGLAFGLQEIFANFVSGIILMFERPIRIGDVITVDQFTGVVTKIRTRATTIVNWDRKEYVIPNRDFITGRLINWTLSDAINRIQITVGIAYGSDVDEAKRIILDICEKHPAIIDEPSTSITFEEFGDNTLNLVVRTFLGQIDGRLGVVDSLHTQINNAFKEAGIEIAFPQRDLHLRSIDEQLIQYFESRANSMPKR